VAFFSIIIPSYNRALTIERAIRSCLRQSFSDFEILVVDDGSTDDTAAVVAGFEDPRILYIQQENRGASAARNRGAAAAGGEFLAFLDSDDEFAARKLTAFHAEIVEAGEAAHQTVWYSSLYFDRGKGNRMVKPDRAINPDEAVGDYLFAHEGMMQTSTLVLGREFFLTVGFDENLRNLEDLDLCLRLEKKAAAFRMLEAPLVVWHDDVQKNRLSYTTTAEEVLTWMTDRNHLLSERARYGFLAHYLVPLAVRRSPVATNRILTAAVWRGSISAPRAVALLMRGMAPSLYGSLRDLLTARSTAHHDPR
jgi:glycosyltransferase involved in cell wall biosynthesis